jgi:hypothetical protein
MRRLALIAVLLASLVAAAPAVAKEVHSVTACGSDDCVEVAEGGLLVAMRDVGPPADPPSAAAPFYRLTTAIGDGRRVFERWHSMWVPSAGLLLGEDGTWTAVRPGVEAALKPVVAGLETFPAARLPGVPAATAEAAEPPAAPAEPPAAPAKAAEPPAAPAEPPAAPAEPPAAPAEPPAARAEPPAAPAEPAPASSPGESLLLPVLAIAIALAAAGLLARRELIGRRAAHE